MRPGIFDLNLYRGDTYAWEFVCYTTTGAPADFNGVTAKAQVRDKRGGATTMATLYTQVTLPNKILVKVLSEHWIASGINKTSAVWDLQLTYSDADISVVTIITGDVHVTWDVTETWTLSPLAAPATRATREETIHV